MEPTDEYMRQSKKENIEKVLASEAKYNPLWVGACGGADPDSGPFEAEFYLVRIPLTIIIVLMIWSIVQQIRRLMGR